MKTEALVLPAGRARTADFLALTKPRLNLLVVLTTAVGHYLGAGASTEPVTLVYTMLGTALVAGGAAAINQIAEREADALMHRTRTRPLPDGRLHPVEATWFAATVTVLGLALLAWGANLLAATVALVTLVSYAAIYTPLKRRTWLATMVGALPGALPVVIGWAAARNELSIEAWVLFAIVFLWQTPHFLAIAWLYRDDYRRAGFPLLPVVEPDGRSTGWQAVAYATALVPVSLAPLLVGLAGGVYAVGAPILSVGFAVLALRFFARRTSAAARTLFLGSLTYLPLLWGLMIAERLIR